MYKDKYGSKLVGRVLRYALMTGAVVAVSLSPAQAQDEAAEEEDMEQVTVTGTRIKRANLTSTSPVTQVDADEFLYAGITRVEDLMNDLPQVFASNTSGDSNGATGTATIDLRGLGSVRTLVLLDGRRLPMGSPSGGGTAADVNQIPAGLIERVEVLTGGASATYGSDAVAGVVNFITKRDFEGIQIDYQHSFYRHKNDNSVADVVRDTGFDLPDSTVSDGNTDDLSLLLGVNTGDGRGNITAYATYRNIEEIRQANRDYSACALGGSPDEFSCGGSSTIPDGRFTDFGVLANPPCVMIDDPDSDDPADMVCEEVPEFYTSGPNAGLPTGNVGTDQNDNDCHDADGNDIPCIMTRPVDPWVGGPSNGATVWPGSFDYLVDGTSFVNRSGHPRALYNYAPNNFYQRPDKRTTFGATGHYEFSEHAKVYLQLNFMDDRSLAQIAPSGAFFVTDSLSCGNPLMSDQQRQLLCDQYLLGPTDRQDVYIGRRNVEGGFRADDLRHTAYRTVVGVEGQINDTWSYDAFANFGKVSYIQTYRNDLSSTRIARALNVVDDGDGNAVCQSVVDGSDPDCLPWNLFETGGVTPGSAVLDYLVLPLFGRGETQQDQFVGYVTGDLDAKLPSADQGIAVAVGYEFRKEKLVFEPDNGFESGDGAGQGGPIQGVEGKFDVSEIFAEASIPITSSISTDIGFRSSDYSYDKSTTTYKLAGEYQATSSLGFRTSVQRAVRAGNLRELYRPLAIGLFDMSEDPCAGSTPTATLEQCARTGVTASQYGTISDSPAGQYNATFGGNADLEPEESDTLSLGVVYSAENFSITVDYFDIEVTGAIDSDPEFIFNQCLETGAAEYCDAIHRGESTGTLWVGSDTIIAPDTNIGFFKTAGFDIQADYDLQLGDKGDLNFNFVGTLLQTWDEQNAPNAVVVDCVGKWGSSCGRPTPKWVHNLRTTWVTPWDASISLSWRHIGGVDDLGANEAHFGSLNYLDVAALWQYSEHVGFRFGINNLLDKDPPLTADAGPSIFGNGNTFPGVYDALGQYIFLGASLTY